VVGLVFGAVGLLPAAPFLHSNQGGVWDAGNALRIGRFVAVVDGFRLLKLSYK
jgi:hypothetical protein